MGVTTVTVGSTRPPPRPVAKTSKPIAGVGGAVQRWLGPVAAMGGRASTVAVLLHPELELEQRRQWVEQVLETHPDWEVSEVSAEDLIDRLQRWVPYLEELVGTGDASMPPLIEISTANLESLAALQNQPEVLAVGPQSSIQQLLGRVASRLSWVIGALSVILAAGAVLLAAIWVHLELYRHADELTIMRLVGATEGTIRGPFLVAVGVPGAVAGLVAVAVSRVTTVGLSRMVMVLGLPAVTMTPDIILIQLAASVVLPLVAAALTLARHASEEFEG